MLKRLTFGGLLLTGLALVGYGDHVIGYPLLTTIILFLVVVQAQKELLQMLGVSGRGEFLGAVIGAFLIFGGSVVAASEGCEVPVSTVWIVALVLFMILVLVATTLRLQVGTLKDEEAVPGQIAVLVFSLLYIVLPMACLQQIAITQGTIFAALLVVASKCGDIGGYLVGSQIGKHKVLPRVSPNKSWEGSCAGFLLTFLAFFLMHRSGLTQLRNFDLLDLVLLSIVVNVATQLGDFAESALKRLCAVKDSANIVPTFGGALDVLDSLVFAVPAAALFLYPLF